MKVLKDLLEYSSLLDFGPITRDAALLFLPELLKENPVELVKKTYLEYPGTYNSYLITVIPEVIVELWPKDFREIITFLGNQVGHQNGLFNFMYSFFKFYKVDLFDFVFESNIPVRKKLGIAKVFSKNPTFLFLDHDDTWFFTKEHVGLTLSEVHSVGEIITERLKPTDRGYNPLEMQNYFLDQTNLLSQELFSDEN